MSPPCRHFYTSEGLSSSPVQAADLLFLYTSACLRRFASLDMLPQFALPRRSAPLPAHWGACRKVSPPSCEPQFFLYFRMSPPLRVSRHAPPIRTPAPPSAAPCSLGGVSEGLSSLVRAAVLLILPHVFAASRLSTCCPQFALPRRPAPLPAHWGACRKGSPPPSCKPQFFLYFRMSPPLRASRHAAPNSHSRAAQRRSLLIRGRIGRALLLSRASTSRRRDFPILEV